MAKKYAKPPLVEAICEFRFEQGAPWDMAVPGLVYEQLKGDFPKRRRAAELENTVEAGPGGLSYEITKTERVQFWKEDETSLVQIGPNRLAVNVLKPYPGWTSFLPLIERSLDVYRGTAEPKALFSLSLHYRNHIDFANDAVQLRDNFNYYPFTGPELSFSKHGTFLVGIEVPYEDERDLLKIEMASRASVKPATLALRLDLDYYLGRSKEVNFGGSRDWLDLAHGRLEHAFEACLKDKLRASFEQVEP
ncbi:MAG: TIGR04255 family protein [Pseudomonadota bacterium]